MDSWVVEALLVGYRIPFDRPPPLSKCPISPATVKAMVEFIRTNFPDAIASPAQKSSRSFDVSASVGVTDPATPSGSLLGWSQVMSDSFSDTQKKFSQRIQEGRACHTLWSHIVSSPGL